LLPFLERNLANIVNTMQGPFLAGSRRISAKTVAKQPLSCPRFCLGGYLANLAKVRQAANKEERDRVIAEHVNSYISEVGNDGELADAFQTWVERS
jgi:hypothetical protein